MTYLLALPILLVSLAACLGYGWLWLRLLGRHRGEDPLRPFYAAALGMGTLAYLVLAVGLLGFLNRTVLGALVGAGWIPALIGARDLFRREPRSEGAVAPAERWAAVALLAGLAVLALLSFITTLRPPDGVDWDGLSYHLAAPKIYLHDGRIGLIAYDSHTDYPITIEMLFTLGLAFGGPGTAKLFHWACGWLTAAAVGVWASRLQVNGRRAPAWCGPAAAAAFASMPIVLWEMAAAYVDLGTALFQLLALTALIDATSNRVPATQVAATTSRSVPSDTGALPVSGGRLREVVAAVSNRPANTPDTRGMILAGALTGFALGTKMTALVQFGILGLMLLPPLLRRSSEVRGPAFRALAGYAAAAVLIASPWYLKSWLWVHNPVYPFFYSLFPHSYSWDQACAVGYTGEQWTFGLGHPLALAKEAAKQFPERGFGGVLEALGRALWALVMLPWNLAVHGREFYINQRTLIGDKLGTIGPLWAGLLPLLPFARGLDPRVRPVLIYSLLSVSAWFFLTQQARYLLPLLAPLAAVAVLVVPGLDRRSLRLGAGAFLAAGLLMLFANRGPAGLLNVELAQGAWSVVSGEMSEKEYLQVQLGSLHEASEYVNTLPESSRVALYQETRGFYFDRRYFWANPLQHTHIPYDELRTGDELVEALRRFGITHVLINYSFSRGVDQFSWYRLLMAAIQSGRLQETFRSRGAEFQQKGIMVYQIR